MSDHERPREIRVRWVPETIPIKDVYGHGSFSEHENRRVDDGTMLWQKAVVEAHDDTGWVFVESPVGICLDPPGSSIWDELGRELANEAITLERIRVRASATAADALHGPCLFCGTMLTHFNDGGDGWLAGSMVAPRKVTYWLYCHSGCDDGSSQDAIWRCYCAPGYTENAGPLCHECGCIRSMAINDPDG